MMTNKYTVYLQSSNSFLKKLDKNESKYQVTSTSSLSNLEPNANTNTKNDNSKFHYVKNFNQSLLAQYLKQSVVNSNLTKNNSVTKWLQDLRMMSENECLCVLQAKSLAGKLNQLKLNGICKDSQNSDSDLSSSRKSSIKNFPDYSVYEFLEIVLDKKEYINEELKKVYKKVEKRSFQNITVNIKKIVNDMQYLVDLFNHMNLMSRKPYNLKPNNFQTDVFKDQNKEIEAKICTNLNSLRKFIQNQTEESNSLLDVIKNLDDLFEVYYQNILKLCIQIQLGSINKNESVESIKQILNQILDISLKYEFVKKIIISENGILILISTLKDPYFKNILDLILRTLSILCSHLDSFKSLTKIDCFGILTDILCDEKASEWTRTECAGCIAQITSPYLDFCDNLTGFLENLEDLTRALTILCRDSSDIEIFLIGTAALANITFLDKMACEFLNRFSTAQVLIENYYLKQYNSIFVKDQITTILANMALLENCRYDIAEFNGLNLLVDFLNERPLNYLNNNTIESELNACERVQQKAAIAISRFCKESKYTSQLIELGVVSRISYLCRNASERNNSDSVLVACLAALRQIAISSESLESSNLLLEADIQQLIKPKPGDSFLQCSSTEESYV